jgi:imidazolonepropionase-like amidohydrolase
MTRILPPAAAGLLLFLPLAAQDGVTVLRGARLLAGEGAAIEDGVLVIAGGRVQSVGAADAAIPDGARVIDVKGRTITPGLVDAGAQVGVLPRDWNEQTEEVTPHMKILDAFDPSDKRIERARSRGVTAVHLTPGNRNVIGGLGAVVKTAGRTLDELVVRDETALRVALGSEPSAGNRAIRGGMPAGIYYRRPSTRMGVVWTLRKAMYDALEYKQRTLGADGAAGDDPAMEVLLRVLDRKLVVHTTARAEQDLRTALRLAEEFGYETVLDECTELYRVTDLVHAAGAKVLLGAPSADRASGAGAGDQAQPRWHTAKLLAEKGIPFAIQTGTDGSALDLIDEATFAVRNGLPAAQALEAITLSPARILGVADRIGSLAPGKDADFVVWSGNPFDPSSVAEAVYVNGRPTDR